MSIFAQTCLQGWERTDQLEYQVRDRSGLYPNVAHGTVREAPSRRR